ncbi:phosphate ABC transporter substrate-binding protein PstS [Swaminathania salitolerans]|uniref:Phosphate-binding protein PstS n=1 Tax=Swaminathania salitolerans TaxID=182838 RepID=A0A511BTZ1_9PROT|nr:phosphate ABC transporter substrate-binding protein PstS [Swaminathania salitolerans]GBQ14331.1 phosphate-binding periplasmic protein [Swaminathania salitolerans LMG 21291]GEL02994.1 phosphate-binding protein PstS [Swaminathania salitolerans]
MTLTKRFALLAGLAFLPLSAPAQGQTVTGAGSSFAAPLYESWGERVHQKDGVEVNYQSVGSGAGINQVVAGTVDFGASDKPARPGLLAAHHLYQFPTALGAIVVIVNIPGIPAGAVRLDGPTLEAIYAGEIGAWNDPRIAAQNPGLDLPDEAVAAVHRADASGTTFVFTSYLSRVSPSWKTGTGAGTSVAWSSGAGARGNDGVAATVRQTIGGIGYVEYAYARHNHLPMARLRNRDGAYVEAGPAAFAAAADRADWAHAQNHVVDLLDLAGPGVWPIMSATYALVPLKGNPGTRHFFETGLTEGEEDARTLDYVVLPEKVRSEILEAWPG